MQAVELRAVGQVEESDQKHIRVNDPLNRYSLFTS